MNKKKNAKKKLFAIIPRIFYFIYLFIFIDLHIRKLRIVLLQPIKLQKGIPYNNNNRSKASRYLLQTYK